MSAGRIVRVGSPADVWGDPRTEMVARFLGHRNIVDVGPRGQSPYGVLQVPAGRALVRSDGFTAATDRTDVRAEVIECRFGGERYTLTAKTVPDRADLALGWPTPVARGTVLDLAVDRAAVAPLTS